MSEALWGVIIGGLIASISPVISHFAESRRWKLERKLEHLRERRARLAVLTSETSLTLRESMANNAYPIATIAEIMVHMPPVVRECFREWSKVPDPTSVQGQDAFIKMCAAMQAAVAQIDTQIATLIDV